MGTTAAPPPRFAFDNSYARLPPRFYTRLAPTPVRAPALLQLNVDLAGELGLDPEALAGPEGVAVLAGNHVPEGAEPLAQVYAGHQFGGWVPRLGDGRAILLGEVIDVQGRRRDIQLKGSGPTPYSRRGDGRAWLGPVLREYVLSEAMHALGVPTTRALAAVATGEPVFRGRALPGAVLTRVAASHIRVGTFEYFAARDDREALTLLTQQAIARHYPELRTEIDLEVEQPLALLAAVVASQSLLVARWQSVGFIHGVMNTDNTALSGETLDYGPCALLDAYHPDTVFSSIDEGGRYAYTNQPQMMLWNLSQLANALLPIMGPEREAAVAAATAALQRFAPLHEAHWLSCFRAKLGLQEPRDGDRRLIESLLQRMAEQRADFTRTFRGLADGSARAELAEPAALDAWTEQWHQRLAEEGASVALRADALRRANPAFIPRNHRVEQAIQAAVAGDLGPFERLVVVLRRPFEDQPEHQALSVGPRPEEVVQETFCGT